MTNLILNMYVSGVVLNLKHISVVFQEIFVHHFAKINTQHYTNLERKDLDTVIKQECYKV